VLPETAVAIVAMLPERTKLDSEPIRLLDNWFVNTGAGVVLQAED
jgi:hypothetical protein